MQLSKWLKGQLEALVSVQRCLLGQTASVGMRVREPDLTVLMWTGVRVHLYILTEEVKPRTIKNIVQGDTGIGISSLFMVAPHLLPPDKSLVTPPDWLMAVHALTHERIYSYATHGEPHLLQLHFEPTGIPEQRSVMYGPAATIHQLRYSRVTIKQSSVKGFWMVADFGNHLFWKDDTARYQPPPRAQYGSRRAESTARQQEHPASHHARRNQSQSPPPAAQPARSRLELSYEMLGVELTATRDEVKTAFRKMALKLHPDVSDLSKAEAEARFKALAEAYEYIKTEKKW